MSGSTYAALVIGGLIGFVVGCWLSRFINEESRRQLASIRELSDAMDVNRKEMLELYERMKKTSEQSGNCLAEADKLHAELEQYLQNMQERREGISAK